VPPELRIRQHAEMRIAVVVFPGADDLDVFGPFEVLANAARAGCPVEISLVGAHGVEPVRTFHGATVTPDRTLAGPPAPELVVVPGGGFNDPAPDGARAEARRGALPALLRELHAGGATLASVCTGAGILATTGLLAGRPVATHHRARDEVAAAGADVHDARVVDDGDLLSCGGVTAGLDLGLHLVRRTWGAGVAMAIAAEIEYEPTGSVHLGPRAPTPDSS